MFLHNQDTRTTGLNQDTTGAGAGAGDATLLLSLDGLAVTLVEPSAAGTLLVEVATAAETAAACPTCGVISTRVKQHVCTRPRDLPHGRTRLELVWRKRRWYCRESSCGRTSFTESTPAVPAGARITTRLREHAGDLVVDGLCATVAAAGRMTGVSWPTAMDAVRAAAERVLDEAPDPVEVLGVDEVRRGRPRWRPAEPAQPPTPAPEPPVRVGRLLALVLGIKARDERREVAAVHGRSQPREHVSGRIHRFPVHRNLRTIRSSKATLYVLKMVPDGNACVLTGSLMNVPGVCVLALNGQASTSVTCPLPNVSAPRRGYSAQCCTALA